MHMHIYSVQSLTVSSRCQPSPAQVHKNISPHSITSIAHPRDLTPHQKAAEHRHLFVLCSSKVDNLARQVVSTRTQQVWRRGQVSRLCRATEPETGYDGTYRRPSVFTGTILGFLRHLALLHCSVLSSLSPFSPPTSLIPKNDRVPCKDKVPFPHYVPVLFPVQGRGSLAGDFLQTAGYLSSPLPRGL
ncbi:hypothetical protein CDEST_01039 [Colletotrichum destructivum]|uniref:Uncharacterized protein n=1 Tax=Colletotrichum destructivum TaxID=34406 RepID=A0AAX4HYJ5_9PEZI|nr:hypothetical protein CDEST_01039 [Colletotrichum destructivum]